MSDLTANQEEVRRLIALADTIAPPGESIPVDASWHQELHSADVATLIAVTGALNAEPGKPAAKRKALREAVMAEVERKNTERVIGTMERLDAATTTLNARMLWLAIGGVILAVAQVVAGIIQIYLADK